MVLVVVEVFRRVWDGSGEGGFFCGRVGDLDCFKVGVKISFDVIKLFLVRVLVRNLGYVFMFWGIS